MSGYSHIDLDGLYQRVEKHERTFREPVDEMKGQADCVLAAARKVGESWSGSCMGYHNALYFGTFEKPGTNRFNVEWGCLRGTPPGWHEREPPEVKQRIEDLAKIQVDSLEDRDKQIAQSAEDLRDELTLELSSLDSLTGFVKEKELLHQIEKLDWGDIAGKKYIADFVNSCPRATRDFAAINEGRRIPAHAYYESVAIQALQHSVATEEFWKQSKRLLKRLQTMVPSVDRGREEATGGEREQPATHVTTVYNLHGAHSRLNIRSSDQSLNISNVTNEQLFLSLREHIKENVLDDTDRAELLERVSELEKATDKKALLERYQEFIAAASNHMTLIAPFIPALTQLLR